MKTTLMHNLSAVYFINQPLHISGIFVAHHQDVYYIYTIIGTYCGFSVDCLLSKFHLNPANRQSTKIHNMYQLLYIYSIPPDYGLQICPKHVEVD